MNKRGQLAIFVILGIVILIGAILIFSLDYIKEKAGIGIKDAFAAPIQQYVETCLKSAAESAILENSRHGGYFYLPDLSTAELTENVPFFYDAEEDDHVLFPDMQIFADEIANYVDAVMFVCLNDFKPFKEQGFEITFEEPSTDAMLDMSDTQKLTLTTNMHVTIKKAEQTRELTHFAADVQAEQFYQDIMAAKAVVESVEEQGICVTCFSEVAEKYDLFVGILPVVENNKNIDIIDIADNNYKINSEDYHLKFAVRYGESDEG